MKTFDCQQGSPDWWEVRKGIPTASNFDRIITAVKAEPSKSQDEYIRELIGDLISLNPPYLTERPGHTAPMRNGTDIEPEARKFYSFETNEPVEQVGFCLTDDGHYGASPDGLVGEFGGLELKCPLPKTQIEYILNPDKLLTSYRQQVHGALLVTGRKWWDILSYSAGLKPVLIRVVPDEFTEALRAELDKFWVRYQALLTRIREAK